MSYETPKLGFIDVDERKRSFLNHFESDKNTLPLTHFVEWFSGGTLDSIWTQYDRAGTGTHIMDDTIDGGFKYTTDTTTNDSGGIDFGGINHYSATGSVVYVIGNKEVAADSQWIFAMNEENSGDFSSGSDNYLVANNSAGSGKIRLNTRLGAGLTSTDSSLDDDIIAHLFKMIARSSNITLSIEDILEVTITTDLPAEKLQPCWRQLTLTGTAKVGHIRRLEVYNT